MLAINMFGFWSSHGTWWWWLMNADYRLGLIDGKLARRVF